MYQVDCIFRYLFLLSMSPVQIWFTAHELFFFISHSCFIKINPASSGNSFNFKSLSLLHRVSNKQRRHSQRENTGEASESPPRLRLWSVLMSRRLLLIGTLVLFLLEQWGWSCEKAGISLSWPKVKETVLLWCVNTGGPGVASGFLLGPCRN